jgi:hypothetical protein
MTKRHADTPLAIDAATAKTSKQRTIDALIKASPSVVLLPDGELVLYRSTRSLLYQCRFKLADGKWHICDGARKVAGRSMVCLTFDQGFAVCEGMTVCDGSQNFQ